MPCVIQILRLISVFHRPSVQLMHFFFISLNIYGSQDTRERGWPFVTLLYHFHPLQLHLDISQAIAVESSTLHKADSRARTVNQWSPSATRQHLSCGPFLRQFRTHTIFNEYKQKGGKYVNSENILVFSDGATQNC